MRLTAAARKMLDEHLDQLRGRVIREAARGAGVVAGTAETRVAIARVALADRLLPTRPSFAMALLGVMLGVALVGTAALAFGRAGNALLGALLGAAVTVVAGVMVAVVRTARDEVASEFLKRFNELEALATVVSGHRLSLRKAVEAVWPREDALVFGRLLRLRNALLHDDGAPPGRAELMAMLLEVDRLATVAERAAKRGG